MKKNSFHIFTICKQMNYKPFFINENAFLTFF